ncbi:methyltransferase family 21, putative [Bodo saltans]|uniref:Methyltransferase family 21, putative n=1 Tax=Bodo saltans TaxID=75058 RepID=A0A0S4JAX4_BODSA|nr:methyltransferase family 21, putative [Bodo saltans]|eukprot:CUG86133.1 methyltransferase family 21, putative [Bodo saltans]
MMNKRRNPLHHGSSKGHVRIVQLCFAAVAIAVCSLVFWSSMKTNATAPTLSVKDDEPLAKTSKRIGDVSRSALEELRETTERALRSLSSKKPRTPNIGKALFEKRERMVHPLRTSSIAHLVVNTSVEADIPPAAGLLTMCRALSHRHVKTQPTYTQCTYGLDDVVSSFVHMQGFWRDCLPQVALATLARLYMEPNDDGSFSTIDVGGNIGACALLLGSRGFHVTSFEPVLRNIHAFHQSVFVNSMQKNILLVGAAASDSSLETKVITIEVGNHGNAAMINPKLSVGAALAKTMEKVETERITTVRVDDIATASTHVHFAKFDCQGCELGALRGSEMTLLRRGAIDVLYVEVDSRLSRANGHDPLEMLQLLNTHSYRLYVAYGELTKEILATDFNQFVEACVEDPRDVVAVSAKFTARVPEDVLHQVMSLSVDSLETWLTDSNETDYGVLPMIEHSLHP